MTPKTFLLPVLLLLLAVVVTLLLIGRFGENDAFVIDEAAIFDDTERRSLETFHAFLLQDHDIDYRILTTREAGDINSFANSQFRERGIGHHSNQQRGLLLVIDANAQAVRLEVGASLEAVFVDAFIAHIERDQMIPFFRNGRPGDGILAATEMIVTRAQNAARKAGFQDELWYSGSTGAGATTAIASAPSRSTSNEPVAAGSSPQATLNAYAEAMASTNLEPDLAIYTRDSQRMLAGWVVTPAQADNSARSIRQCAPAETRFSQDGRYAVMRYPVSKRQCNPYFFMFEEGAWRLDLTMMQKAIRFGRNNQWHFVPSIRHDYAFAFTDWRFDSNGFPK